jgi:hypothetical protein
VKRNGVCNPVTHVLKAIKVVTTQPINPWLAAFFLVEIDKTVTFLVDFSGFYTK